MKKERERLEKSNFVEQKNKHEISQSQQKLNSLVMSKVYESRLPCKI